MNFRALQAARESVSIKLLAEGPELYHWMVEPRETRTPDLLIANERRLEGIVTTKRQFVTFRPTIILRRLRDRIQFVALLLASG
jgi:hypothetical protein